MSQHEIAIAIARHDTYLSRVSEMLACLKEGRELPRELQFDNTEIPHLDHFLEALASRLLQKTIPFDDIWVAPGLYANRSDYLNHYPSGWLESFHRGLTLSKAFFHAFTDKTTGDKPVINYNITIKDVIGPVNVLSSLDGAVQTIKNSPALSNVGKDTLAALIEELKSSLAAAPASLAEDAAVISEQAQTVADELSKTPPRHSALKIKSSGLIEAAKTIEAVVPTAIAVARKIAEFVTGLA